MRSSTPSRSARPADLAAAVCVLAGLCAPSLADPPADGLVAYWSFDAGTAADDSGHGHHGTIYGATPCAGACNGGLHFDGEDDYVDIGNLGTDVHSFIIWVKPDETITPASSVRGLVQFQSDLVLYLGSCTGAVVDETITLVGVVGGGNQRTAVIGLNITHTDWHMIACVWNAGADRYDIYYDGELQTVTCGTRVHVPLMSSGDVLLGTVPPSAIYDGAIDESRVYDQALGAEEVLGLYADCEGSAGACCGADHSCTVALPSDCTGNWMGAGTDCSSDCNDSGIADVCEIAAGISPDCNDNGLPDECDLAAETSTDWDTNGVPDECEDCNNNGLPDACDLPGGCSVGDCAAAPTCGGSTDENGDGVPDECELLVLHVDDDAPLGGDGLTWDTAFRYLQDAFAAAELASQPEVIIRVAAGTYRPDRDEAGAVVPGDRTATFALQNDVSILGGFAGRVAPDPDERNTVTYETTLSGDLNDDDGPVYVEDIAACYSGFEVPLEPGCEAFDFDDNGSVDWSDLQYFLDTSAYGENSLHVVTAAAAVDATAVLDGVTIRGGYAIGNPSSQGAGIVFACDASPTLNACTFRGNCAETAGGLSSENGGDTTLTNCVFVGNVSQSRAGALCAALTDLSLSNCTLIANVVQVGEGGALATAGCRVTLTGCIFTANHAGFAGAAFFEGGEGDELALTGCRFEQNGAMAMAGGVWVQQGIATLVDCTFMANQAQTEAGGLSAWTDELTVVNCRFLGNQGAGTYIQHFGTEPAVLTNCTYSGNTRAGGVWIDFGDVALVNCTLGGNSADTQGGGVYNYEANVALFNCILWGNTAPSGPQIDGQATVTYSCVQGGWSGTGNIAGNPLFMDSDGPDNTIGTEDDDLRPIDGSPCIDAADNTAVPPDAADLDGDGDLAERVPQDLDRQARFVDHPDTVDSGVSDPPSYPGVVDMGAYEFGTVGPGDDCNSPFIVNIPTDLTPEYVDAHQTTCTRGDDYASTCLHEWGWYSGGDDIIYALVVSGAPVCLDIEVTLHSMQYPVGVSLAAECPPVEACLATGFSGYSGAVATINRLDLAPGTYYLMVNSWPPEGCLTDFTLTIALSADCPQGACCVDAACTVATAAECAVQGGVYAGDDTDCAVDCNDSGMADACDIAFEASDDCNGNGIPDECDITSGLSPDGNGNGRPDECEAAVLYVDGSAPSDGNGIAWGTAYSHLQNALTTAANSTQPAVEIWVAGGPQGVYTPDLGYGVDAGDREASFHLRNNTALYGGFPPGGGVWENRDPQVYETTLHGDLAGDDSAPFTNITDNARHIVDGSGVDATAVLDGFVIASGNADGDVVPLYNGAGLLVTDGGSPIVTNCVFRHNSAWGGAGVYVWEGAPAFGDCLFDANTATHGAGLCSNYGQTALTNCTFTYNIAASAAGLDNAGQLALTGCTFLCNTAEDRGGGMENCSGAATLESCTFDRNSANAGGGLYDRVGIMLVDCLFTGNSNAGMAVNGGTPSLVNCTFAGNTSSARGGGLYTYQGDANLTNCIFTGNSAAQGGAIGLREGGSTLVNCTIGGNWASGDGGGLYVLQSDPSLANCILWDNSDSSGTDESAQVHVDSGTAVLDYCCIQGGWSGPGGTGIVADEPDWLDLDGLDNTLGTADDDVRLLPGSPCLEAGDNTALPADVADLDDDEDTAEAIPFDRGGNPRVLDDVVDIGAYEGPAQAFLLSTQTVTIAEGGSASFTVALAMNPGGSVVATVSHHDGDPDITVQSGGTLLFDSGNYDIPQTVVLTAADDGDFTDGAAAIWVMADGVNPGAVTAVEADNDQAPAVVFVDASATGMHSGLSWEDAFTELREALAAAAAHPEVQQAWVAAGTYAPAEPGGDRFATFELLDGLALYGGFAGGEVSIDERDVVAHATILSGDLDANDSPGGFVGYNENCYHVVSAAAVDATTILDGFTIRGGWANGAQPHNRGGGVYNTGAPLIRNCLICLNGGNYGGGLFNTGNATLIDCAFVHNTSQRGAGLYSRTSSLRVCNTTFLANSGVYGSAAFFNSSGAPTLEGCVFAGNDTLAGTLAADNAKPSLVNCAFVNNAAELLAGAIYSFDDASRITLSNCILWNNCAPLGPAVALEGGIVSVSYSNVEGGQSGVHIHGGTLLWNEGNIALDPLLADADGPDDIPGTADDDLRLTGTSPCIDAGDNRPVPACLIDHDHNLRHWDDPTTPDTGFGDAPIVDMGPFEFGSPAGSDCDGNLLDDDCELATGDANDCDENGLLDVCDISAGTHTDCNANGRPDACEIPVDSPAPGGPFFCTADCDPDCNVNGIPDDCDIAACPPDDPDCDDCNNNGAPDACDISDGFSEDLDEDGVPDECSEWDPPRAGREAGLWSVAENWRPPIVPDNDALRSFGVTIRDDAAEVVLDLDVGINTLRLLDGARLDVTAGSLGIQSPFGIFNEGELTIGDGRSVSASDEALLIDGNGLLRLDGPGALLSSGAAGTITSRATITGEGIVEGNFVNEGTVCADVAAATLTITGPGTIVNNGTISATHTGRLEVVNTDVTGSGDYIADGGTIRVGDDDGPVSLAGSSLVVTGASGLLDTPGAAYAQFSGPAAFTLGGAWQGSAGAAATLAAESLAIADDGDAGDGGAVLLTGTMSLLVAGDVTVDEGNPSVGAPPALNVEDSAHLEIGGSFTLFGAPSVRVDSPETVLLGGDFNNWSIAATLFDWDAGHLSLVGSGPATFEVAGTDVGPDAIGLIDNFAIGELEIASGAHVQCVDLADNDGDAQHPCGEALYTHRLVLRAGAAVEVVDCRIYYAELLDEGATLTTTGCGGLLSVALGDLDCDGSRDLGDIGPFVLALIDPAAYAAVYPDCAILNGDTNGDVRVNGGDIQPFVDRLLGL